MYADLIAAMGYRVGQIVDCVEQAGITADTLIVFSSDNAIRYGSAVGFGGSNGPWRRGFNTPPSERSMRVPAIARWPGKIPAFPLVFDLGCDPGGRANLFFDKMDIGWENANVLPSLFQYMKSIAQYPNIKPGEEFTGYKMQLPKSA